MAAATANSACATEWQSSRVEQMLTATRRLPQNLQRLFEVLYVKGLAEDQACEALGLSPEALAVGKLSMLRSLKAAAS